MLHWLSKLVSWWRTPAVERPAQPPVITTPSRIERIILTDGVARTLFDDYADHRHSPRGNEEIGWILLGLRNAGEAIALAALPAGTQRDAGMAHIQFNSMAQGLASRIVRQRDKRLQIIGVVHTHPGSLRVPSDGDFQGDSRWVGQLRGSEGVFGIGTADLRPDETASVHMQIQGKLGYFWYALAAGDRRYRTLPVHVTSGPDLAQTLRPVWSVIESYAEPLEKLCRQFAKVQFDVVEDEADPSDRAKIKAFSLLVEIPLATQKEQLRLLLNEGEARYYWDRQGELLAIDPHEPLLDRAVYLILAELAQEPNARECETPSLVES